MKLHILLFAFILQTGLSSYAQEIELTANRIHGLLIFVYSNAGRRGYSPYIKEFTEKSGFKDQMKKIIGDFSKLEKSLRLGTDYRPEAKGYNDGFSVSDIAEIQSAYATDVDDLMLRIQHLMPIEDWRALKEMLKAALPIYEKLIWNPCKTEILAAEKLYRKKITDWKVNQLLAKAEKFYGTSWPKDFKFRIALYPIPNSSPEPNTHTLSGFESFGFIVGETEDVAGHFEILFHELMHSLYSSQDTAFKQKLLGFYELDKKDADLPFRRGAQEFSNEFYASTLANGWFYETVTGGTDPTEWNSEDHINTMAHAMFDFTKDYLKNGKTIDADYVKKYISEFKVNFPKYHMEPEYLLQSVELSHTTEAFDSAAIKKSLRNKFSIDSLTVTDDALLLKYKVQISKTGVTTFVLLSTEEVAALSSTALTNLELPESVVKTMKEARTGIWVWWDEEGNQRMFGISEPGKLDELFKTKFIEVAK